MRYTEEEYKAKFEETDPVGWEAIDEVLLKVYPEQEPRHYGPILKYMLGGEDPLDGISIYDNQEQTFHRHIVSYGMSELYYSPESAENEFSGWGFEFTFRIVPFEEDKDAEAYHFIPANGPIRLECDTKLVGIAFAPDPQLGTIETPNGEVAFLQMVGITQKELDWLYEDPTTDRVEELINKMREDNPLLITDLKREKSYV